VADKLRGALTQAERCIDSKKQSAGTAHYRSISQWKQNGVQIGRAARDGEAMFSSFYIAGATGATGAMGTNTSRKTLIRL